MTAPSVRSTGTVTGTPGGSNISAVIAAPASIVVDDILVLGCLTNATRTLTGLPSGWAHVTGSPQVSSGSGSNATLNVVWKRAVAGDVGASTYTFTLNAADYAEGCIESIQGCVNTGSPWDTGTGAPVFAATGSNVTTAPAVSLTTTGTDELLYNAALNQTGATPWTASTGFTKDFDHSGGGSFSTCTGYHKTAATAAATGSVQPVCPSAGQMVNFLGALLSTAGGTTQNATASSTVTATRSAAAEADHNATATSSITSTGIVAASATHIAAASSTVTAAGAAAAEADHNASATAATTATSTAAAEVDHNASASSSVTATGSAAAEADHNASVNQTVTAVGLAAVEVDRPTTAASTVTATLTAAATVTSPGGVNGDLAVTATLAAAVSVTRSTNASLSLLASLIAAGSRTTSVSGSLGVTVSASASASKPGIVIAGRLGVATTGARVQSATVGGIRSATSSGRLNSGSQ